MIYYRTLREFWNSKPKGFIDLVSEETLEKFFQEGKVTIHSTYIECDICGEPEYDPKRMKKFYIEEIKNDDGSVTELHGHAEWVIGKKCEEQVRRAAEKKDWEILPDGPLKIVMQTLNNRMRELKQQGKL